MLLNNNNCFYFKVLHSVFEVFEMSSKNKNRKQTCKEIFCSIYI
jgi:hypothetical protein